MKVVKRLNYFRWLTGVTIIITILATWNLWSCDRCCATAPLIGLQSFISGNTGIAFKSLLILLSVLFIFRVKYVEWLLALIIMLSFADDLNRLLPNTYQLAIVVLLFALTQRNREDDLLSGLRIMQAGVYIWAGLLKLNSAYFSLSAGFVFSALHIEQTPPYYLNYLMLLVAFWEVGIGLLFLTGKKVQQAVWAALILHATITTIIFISGWNRAIITYNLFLLAGNFILFSKSAVFLPRYTISPKAWIQKLAFALFIIMPAFSLVHWWPDYMSSSLYSYRNPTACIFIDENLKKQLPPTTLKAVFPSPGGSYISVSHWVQNETGTAPNPQRFVYQKMYEQLRAKYNCSDSVWLYVY